MNERIAAFPSTTLYGGELVSDASVAKRTLLDLPTAGSSDDARDVLEHPVVFFDTDGCEFYERSEADDTKSLGEGSKANENEAALVAAWARRLVQHGVPPAEVGIVVPYQAQVGVLAGLLRDEFPEMTIGTVDGLQGQERDAVILSLVRSNERGEVGFLGEYRRLNVAMTRPRMQLCVVGDSNTVGKGSGYLKKWMGWLEENADVRYAGDEV
jgi:DNA polymerase alpha-associated DNA helicase A